jgi:beta-glucosidase/6-phospho-beta-glucosidase/beta-galactosidase
MVRVPISTAPQDFLWAVGIENTFVPHTRAGHRRLDEYELMDHYGQWREDIDRAADLGISTLRYGIPWYRVEPAPGRFDWSWTDAVLEQMVRTRGLRPIIDLMHYGTPLWMDNHFVNASFPRRMAEFAGRFAERYAELVSHYTPVNEPAVTAAYCGRDGRWPPYLSGDDGYIKVLLSLARAIARTAQALRAARKDVVLVHVEDVGIERPATPEMADAAALAQQRRLMPLDLMCGMVRADHPLYPWLIEHGAGEAELHELAGSMPEWDILGVNYYPWSNRRIHRRRGGRIGVAFDHHTAALGPVLRMVHDRYRRPLMVTETSSPGTHLDRTRWMHETIAAVREARARGVPLVGYVWFPMFTMIEWKYRWSRKGLEHHLLHLGLWDVVPQAGRLDRSPTPLVDTYRGYVADPLGSIGECGETAPDEVPMDRVA